MAHETRVPSNLPEPCCGLRLYRAGAEDPGVPVMVTYHFGEQVAAILVGEDAGLELSVGDMDGEFLDCAR